MDRNRIALGLVVAGALLNLVDAYLAGNLPFSPASANQQNMVTKINAIAPGVAAGTWLMIAGGGYFVLKHFDVVENVRYT